MSTTVPAQFTVAAGVIKHVWRHPANSGHRTRALLRAARYQAEIRLLGRRTVARLGERSRLWVDLHRTAASMVLYANPPDLPEMLVWRRGAGERGPVHRRRRERRHLHDLGRRAGRGGHRAGARAGHVRAARENVALNGYRVTDGASGRRRPLRHGAVHRRARRRQLPGPGGPAMTDLVTVDSLIGDRYAAGMKVDVEGFEIDVLRGAARALADQRIGLIQLEWNEASTFAVGTDRRPIAELLAGYGYRLHRPDPTGRLAPVTDPGFGADVFARWGRRNRGERCRESAMSRRPAGRGPSAAHRTPRYVFHRTRQPLYERAHPADPWLTPAAIGLLGTLLRPPTAAPNSARGAPRSGSPPAWPRSPASSTTSGGMRPSPPGSKSAVSATSTTSSPPRTSRWSAAATARTPGQRLRLRRRQPGLRARRRALPRLLGQVHPAEDQTGRDAHHRQRQLVPAVPVQGAEFTDADLGPATPVWSAVAAAGGLAHDLDELRGVGHGHLHQAREG